MLRTPTLLALVLGSIACSNGGAPPNDAPNSSDATDVLPPSDAGFDATTDASDAGGSALTLVLHRQAPGSTIVATVNAGSVSGLAIEIVAGGQTVAATDLGGGAYQAQISPPFTSGELPVHAQMQGTTDGPTVTALVLPTIADGWDQPIALGGLVNTPGTEDSSTISPDGEWLIVGTYLVVDALCCISHCAAGPPDGRNDACQHVLGPYTAPARPGMPGADRILSPTRIQNAAPDLCVPGGPDGGDFEIPVDGGVIVPPIPPTTAYGFHRQSDGTFAEPFLIHFRDDGFSGSPFCFTFVDTPTGGHANVIFASKREDDFSGPQHPTATTLTLGTENVLGTYACVNGAVQFTPGAITTLPVSPLSQSAGNTSVGGGWLWSDDETQSPPVTLAARQLGDGGLAPWVPLALPAPGDDRRQPVLANGRLYYFRNVNISSVSWNGGDPSQSGSFGAPQVELAPDAIPPGGLLAIPADRVIALGQPTFATRPDGTTEMYFVYYQRTATGFDGQIGRVPSRR